MNYYNEFDRNRVNGKPLAIDLYCGLGGWSEGLIAEGYQVIGFDITRHQYGESKYPGQLVIQDVLTIHGSQFRDAAVIVASPPCQNYSYLSMPWSRSPDFVRPSGDGWEVLNSAAAKEMREEWEREGPDNRLFDACFRIQREAIEARQMRGHCPCFLSEAFTTCPRCFIPLIVENVRGANEWVSPKSRYNYGSFHLWGDVPAIMPIQAKRGVKGFGGGWFHNSETGAMNPSRNPVEFLEAGGVKVASTDGGRRTEVGKGARFTSRDCGVEGTKIGGDWFSDPKSTCRKHGSRSNARKAASAEIAKIPLPLSEHIARVFKPRAGA